MKTLEERTSTSIAAVLIFVGILLAGNGIFFWTAVVLDKQKALVVENVSVVGVKVHLYRVNEIVLMQILEQDERLRGRKGLGIYNGLVFQSGTSPNDARYEDDVINLRGSDRNDDLNTEWFWLKSVEEAKQYYDKLKKAIKEFNIAWKKIDELHKVAPVIDEVVISEVVK